jgi:MFS family permease
MFLSPLQELPALGRNPVYIGSLFIFVLFQLPIVIAKNFSTVLAFRFLTGFFGSPALATGVSRFYLSQWLTKPNGPFRVLLLATFGPCIS